MAHVVRSDAAAAAAAAGAADAASAHAAPLRAQAVPCRALPVVSLPARAPPARVLLARALHARAPPGAPPAVAVPCARAPSARAAPAVAVPFARAAPAAVLAPAAALALPAGVASLPFRRRSAATVYASRPAGPSLPGSPGRTPGHAGRSGPPAGTPPSRASPPGTAAHSRTGSPSRRTPGVSESRRPRPSCMWRLLAARRPAGSCRVAVSRTRAAAGAWGRARATTGSRAALRTRGPRAPRSTACWTHFPSSAGPCGRGDRPARGRLHSQPTHSLPRTHFVSPAAPSPARSDGPCRLSYPFPLPFTAPSSVARKHTVFPPDSCQIYCRKFESEKLKNSTAHHHTGAIGSKLSLWKTWSGLSCP